MAQVIKKYLSGGKTKPVIVKVDGRDYNYDDIERKIWNTFDEAARKNNWDAETQQAVRDYMTYSLAGLKSGELTYGHNTMNGVSPEYESNGTFNTKGKGIFKRDITNDKRAGATLGTALYNLMFNSGAILEYVTPELKNIGSQFTTDLIQNIIDTLFGGNEQAMNEAWGKLKPADRYTIFKQALANLNYDPDLYKDVDKFNTGRSNLLTLLENPYDESVGISPEISRAYSALGGYKLDEIINETTKTTNSDTLKLLEELWRQHAIDLNITDPAAIEREVAAQKELWRKQLEQGGDAVAELKRLLDSDNLKAALDAYGLYELELKGKWYKKYGSTKGFRLNLDASPGFKIPDFSKLSPAELNVKLKLLYNSIRNNGGRSTENMADAIGLAEHLKSLDGGLTENGKWKVMVGSEDYNDHTVIAYDPNNMAFRIMSMYDFSQYRPQLSKDWIRRYNAINGLNVSEDFLNMLDLILSNKLGGVLKAQAGILFLRELQMRSTGQLTSPQSNLLSVFEQLQALYNANKQSEIDKATSLGITVEEMKKQEAEAEKTKKARDEKIMQTGLSASDKIRAAALLQDVAAFATSFAPGIGSAISAVLGLTSAATDFAADLGDDSVTTGQKFTNLGMNLGLGALGAFPGAGASKFVKLIKFTPVAIAALSAKNVAPKTIAAFEKGYNKGFNTLSREEWKDIYYGLKIIAQGSAGVNRGIRNIRATRETTNTTNDAIKIQTSGGPKTISKAQADALKGKTTAEAEAYLRGLKQVDDQSKFVLGENETLTKSLGNRALSAVTFGKLGKQYLVTTEKGTVRLMTPDEVATKYNGKLPSYYMDYVLRNPGVVSKKDYTRVAEAMGENPVWMRRLATVSSPSLWFNRLKDSKKLNEALNTKMYDFEPNVSASESHLAKVEGLSVKTEYSPNVPLLRAIHRFRRNKAPLMLEQRSTSSGYEISKISDRNKKALNQYVQNALNAKNNPNDYVFAVTKDGKVIINHKSGNNLLTISPDRKVKVKFHNKEIEMTIADAMALGYLITFNKHGGFILRVLQRYYNGGIIPKYAAGNIVGNVSTNNSPWHDTIFAKYWKDLFDGLKSGSFTIDDINGMLDVHHGLYQNYDPNQGAYIGDTNNNVGNYQNNIISKYGFVNSKGITNGWKANRYSTVTNRRYNTDHDNASGNYKPDNVYGGQTDDRRILGRKGDFTSDLLTNYNTLLKSLGLEMYLDDNTEYYKLRKLNDPTNSNTPNNTFTDPVTGETLLIDPNTNKLVAVGNGNPLSKSKVLRVGDDVIKYVKNINPADAIALGRALWGENVNNKITELTKLMTTSLSDPLRESAILHGNYTAQTLALELAGKINAAAQRPISSDAGLSLAVKLDAARKATEALRQGNAEDSEMYWKTLQILNQTNNENAALEVATGNENRTRVAAAYNNRLQAEAARLSANFEQIWQPFWNGIESNYRKEDTLRRLAEIDNWKYGIVSKYEKLNDVVMEEYRARQNLELANWKNNPKKAEYNDNFWTYFAKEISPEYQKRLKLNLYDALEEMYNGLVDFYQYSPFIHNTSSAVSKSYKSGGTLSAADRQALRTTTEINKNIRQAARETYKNIREDKREHRKAMALVSQLSADLIKKAIGAK